MRIGKDWLQNWDLSVQNKISVKNKATYDYLKIEDQAAYTDFKINLPTHNLTIKIQLPWQEQNLERE